MKKMLLIAAVLVVLAALVLACFYKRYNRTTVRRSQTVANVERDLREHLAIGMPREQVESYLDRVHIQHSYVAVSPSTLSYNRTEYALIPDSMQAGVVRGDIQILFRFDEQNLLTSYSVKEIYKGP